MPRPCNPNRAYPYLPRDTSEVKLNAAQYKRDRLTTSSPLGALDPRALTQCPKCNRLVVRRSLYPVATARGLEPHRC